MRRCRRDRHDRGHGVATTGGGAKADRFVTDTRAMSTSLFQVGSAIAGLESPPGLWASATVSARLEAFDRAIPGTRGHVIPRDSLDAHRRELIADAPSLSDAVHRFTNDARRAADPAAGPCRPRRRRG